MKNPILILGLLGAGAAVLFSFAQGAKEKKEAASSGANRELVWTLEPEKMYEVFTQKSDGTKSSYREQVSATEYLSFGDASRDGGTVVEVKEIAA